MRAYAFLRKEWVRSCSASFSSLGAQSILTAPIQNRTWSCRGRGKPDNVYASMAGARPSTDQDGYFLRVALLSTKWQLSPRPSFYRWERVMHLVHPSRFRRKRGDRGHYRTKENSSRRRGFPVKCFHIVNTGKAHGVTAVTASGCYTQLSSAVEKRNGCHQPASPLGAAWRGRDAQSSIRPAKRSLHVCNHYTSAGSQKKGCEWQPKLAFASGPKRKKFPPPAPQTLRKRGSLPNNLPCCPLLATLA